MNKKTIFFHIGTHKTGTTALQSFFVQNRTYLKTKGFHYDFYNKLETNQCYFSPCLLNPILFLIQINTI